jgi:putative transposase
MAEISYRRHRFPPVIIQHAVWLYLRFTLSYRDVEELLAERGFDISYETVRCWVLKFGPAIARRLRRRRPRPSNRWHLDEMVVRIAGGLCGGPSTTKARSSTCWSSADATPGRRCG